MSRVLVADLFVTNRQSDYLYLVSYFSSQFTRITSNLFILSLTFSFSRPFRTRSSSDLAVTPTLVPRSALWTLYALTPPLNNDKNVFHIATF